MKICVVNSLFSPYRRGGAEVVVEGLVKGLVEQNHRVVVITLGRKDEVQHGKNLTIYRIKPLNIFSFLDIHKYPTLLRVLWHIFDVFNFNSARKVRKILQQVKPRVVITHNLKGIGYQIPSQIKKQKIAHIHTLHDVQLSRPSGLIIFGQEKPFVILDKVYEKICRKLFGNPSLVVSPSRWLIDYHRKRGFFYESNIKILQNPVSFIKVEKVNQPSDNKTCQLLFVGQLERSKGILMLAKVLREIDQFAWELTIVGSGAAENDLRKVTQGDKRFKFAGRVDPGEIINYYRQADATVVPSLCYENSPTVISESLVANVPVIASDIGGIPELVNDHYNGLTFAPGDEKNLKEVVSYFLAHEEVRKKLKKNAFISVRGNSIQNYLKEILSDF